MLPQLIEKSCASLNQLYGSCAVKHSSKDVKRAAIMKEKKHKEYALILAFDVRISHEAQVQAKHDNVPIFAADIIYHLKDRFTQHMNAVTAEIKRQSQAVFPAVLQIDQDNIFRKSKGMLFGCDVLEGQLRLGTPICVPDKDFLDIGRITSIVMNERPLQVAKKGQRVCVKLEQDASQAHICLGHHFKHENMLYSRISRESIDALKDDFRDEMSKNDWKALLSMKSLFKIR